MGEVGLKAMMKRRRFPVFAQCRQSGDFDVESRPSNRDFYTLMHFYNFVNMGVAILRELV
jgi:hypothetical protein